MTQPVVRRRHVFFVSGFDPKGASYYHRLYAEGAGRQGKTSGYACDVGRRERTEDPDVQRWCAKWRGDISDPIEPVETTIEFLAWDDLVRAHWPRGVAAVAWGAVLAYVAAGSCGLGLLRVWRQSRRTLIALAYPALLWVLALIVGILLGQLVAQLTFRVGLASDWAPGKTGALAWGLAALVCAGAWWGALRIERKLHTSWLLRIYRFVDLWARGQLPELEKRLDAMASRVYECLRRKDADEVLLVGYSVGSMLAASIMARVVKKCEGDASAACRLSFLTLGQCIPLLGLMPRAHRFRGELAVLAAAADLCWVDYSSPTDWGSFALVDPLEICRVGPAGRRPVMPTMRSPRFHTLFDAEEYTWLRKNKRHLHLQYLMASPKVGEYDYFLMTAGPWHLCRSLSRGSTH
ncbi:hypothetical protein [Polaromonas sp. JS666]|uniref:hypothetical protein n=1 Tax=Polaromonas sp. (strain JS666 / ATCC BAA-500) TaxID=296591 RepID=UPI00005371BA|nr:hypothetical protein [Polaromonas sp. JS666]ABE46795.1 conserved hypothetical protein [Polaromonas sp. JS666]